MIAPGQLNATFAMYWNDMDKCRNAGAYWSLIHVTVCLPDICAALESNDGDTNGSRYINWCDRYLTDPLLSGAERYRMRCKVLHQGRASTDQPAGRYIGFSFGQPANSGAVDHRRVDGTTLNLDVGMLAQETRDGVTQWIQQIEAKPNQPEALNTLRNLASLVQVRQLSFPSPSSSGLGSPVFVTTLKTS